MKHLKKRILDLLKKNRIVYYWFLLAKNTIWKFARDGCPVLAAGIAFFTMFSLFPIMLIGISIIGFKYGQPEAIARINEFLIKFLPGKSNIIINNIETIAHDRGTIGAVGILILLWTGRGIFLAMEHSLNRVWGISTRRSILGRSLTVFFLILMIGILLGISMFLSAIIAYLTQIKVPILNLSLSELSFWGAVNKWLLSTVLIFFIFILLFKVLPHKKFSIREILPGALFATICWKIAEFAYIFYMSNMGKLSEVYGSIGGILGILLWFYIAGLVFMLGAEFNIVFLRLKNSKSINPQS